MVNEYNFLTCMVHKPYKKKVTGNESGSLLLKLDVAVVARRRQEKMLKDIVNIQVLKVDRRLKTLLQLFSEVKRFRVPK